MENTSNEIPAVNRFFTPYQILAFNENPKPEALKKVTIGGGKKAAYVEGEYIRLVLNRLIGQGMWELKTHLNRHDISNIKKDVYEDRQKIREDDWLGVSAVVHTSLIIYARDGSDRTLVYEATTVGDGMTDPKKGISDALDKAIKSAETDGLKRCAINLGRVFGLDINNKVKPEALPQNLNYYKQKLEAHRLRLAESTEKSSSEKVATSTLMTPSNDGSDNQSPPQIAVQASQMNRQEKQPDSETVQVKPRAEPSNLKPEAQQTRGHQENQPQQAAIRPAPQDAEHKSSQSAPTRQEPPHTNNNRQQAPQQERAQSQTTSAPPSAAEQAANTNANGQPPVPEEPKWDLSVIPDNLPDWIDCVRVMVRRIQACLNEAEIQNFIRRNKKLVERLPSYKAENGNEVRDFKARWEYVIKKRYNELGIEFPIPTDQAA